jgi:TonB-like protein
MRWTRYALSLGLGLMAADLPMSRPVARSCCFTQSSEPGCTAISGTGPLCRIEGAVKVMVAVAANGRPTSTKVVGGHPVLAKAAVDAIEKWKWVASSDESSELVEIHFHPE